MEYDQSNPHYKKPDYYSYNPETAEGPQDLVNLDPLVEQVSQYDDALGEPLTHEELHNPPQLKYLHNFKSLFSGESSPYDENGNLRNLRSPASRSLEEFYRNPTRSETALHPDLAEHG